MIMGANNSCVSDPFCTLTPPTLWPFWRIPEIIDVQYTRGYHDWRKFVVNLGY